MISKFRNVTDAENWWEMEEFEKNGGGGWSLIPTEKTNT
jgi:hypothetical protein